MSILIKGMEMPIACVYRKNGHLTLCPLYDIDGYCGALHTEAIHKENGKLSDCPLVHVPPHGDLIDHNALKIAVMDCDAETRIDFLKHAMDCINKAPVVIPSDMPTYGAEEGE